MLAVCLVWCTFVALGNPFSSTTAFGGPSTGRLIEVKLYYHFVTFVWKGFQCGLVVSCLV